MKREYGQMTLAMSRRVTGESVVKDLQWYVAKRKEARS